LLPDAVIPARLDRGHIRPVFLDERDRPWLAVIIDEVNRFCGRPLHELQQCLREPWPCATPVFKVRAALHVLLRRWSAQLAADVTPSEAREALFLAAAEADKPRSAVLVAAASALGVAPAALERSLFADLPGERVVTGPPELPTPDQIALDTNQLIARSLLARSRRVRIRAQGAVRPLVRQAHLRGLICTVEDSGDSPVLDISGPFAVFRHTLLYGRALGEVLPFLAWCARFELQADCVLRGQSGLLHLRSGDPILPAQAPRAFDSKLEERFARDMKKAAPDWDVLREPAAVRAGRHVIFPDFLLQHRLDPQRHCPVEIVGFWTPAYLERKLALLRAAGLSHLILCIDEDRRVADGDMPEGVQVVRFRRRIDPADVLAALPAAVPAAPRKLG
jgi:predicted nuclease of restriction endonuclease-like RecB superfamily